MSGGAHVAHLMTDSERPVTGPSLGATYNTRGQDRIIHCAGCTVGGSPRPSQGAPADQLPNFYRAVLTFERSVNA